MSSLFSLRHLLILVLAVIAVILIYDVIRVSFLLHASSELVKKSYPYQQSPAAAACKIVFLGDSTAVGTGSQNEQQSVAGRFGSLYPNAQIVNQGVNGERIHDLVTNLDPAQIGKADLLVIQIGGNDILHFTPLSSVSTDLDALLTKASQISDHIVIMHTGNVGQAPLFPWYVSFLWKDRSLDLRTMYAADAPAHGALYIDLIGDGSDAVFASDPSKYYGADGLHPSDDGYGVWFDMIQSALATQYGPDYSPCVTSRYAVNF